MSGVTGCCKNMCFSEKSVALFLEQKMAVALLRVMKLHSAAKPVQFYSAAVIEALLQRENLCAELMDNEVLPVLIHAVSLLAEDGAYSYMDEVDGQPEEGA